MYRAGDNAVVRGTFTGPVKVWGPDGTVDRQPMAAPGGNTFVGAKGPLWRVDHDVPAPAKAPIVTAVMVERAGFRMKDLLGTTSTGALDPAKAGGVYVRSTVKVRRKLAPPIYVIAATGDDVGAGRMGGPPDVRAGSNCIAGVGTMDSKGDALISGVKLEAATRLCVVPQLVPPIDLDGDGTLDILAYGQDGTKGFRAWFRLTDDGTLVAGPSEEWDSIP